MLLLQFRLAILAFNAMLVGYGLSADAGLMVAVGTVCTVLLIVFAPGPEIRTRIRTVERIKIVPSKVTGSVVAPHTHVKAAAVREPQSV